MRPRSQPESGTKQCVHSHRYTHKPGAPWRTWTSNTSHTTALSGQLRSRRAVGDLGDAASSPQLGKPKGPHCRMAQRRCPQRLRLSAPERGALIQAPDKNPSNKGEPPFLSLHPPTVSSVSLLTSESAPWETQMNCAHCLTSVLH